MKTPKTKRAKPPPNQSKSFGRSSLIALLNKAETLEDLKAVAMQIDPDLLESLNRRPKPQAPTQQTAQYAKKKLREAKRQRDKSRASREIAHTCPARMDTKTWERICGSLKYALLNLFPRRFNLAFSQDQEDFIKATEMTIRTGGQLAIAMPRGTGKTAILICAVIWSVLIGLHPFVLLVGATATASRELLEQIATEFSTNERLYAHFPELIHPIRRLEGINQRRLLWNGNLITQTWKKDRIVLPNNTTGPGNGAVIAVAGLDGRIRGMTYQRTDGENVRPTLVLVDDPQTRKTAASLPATNKRERILNGDIMGLSGPGKRIAVLVACTVIQTDDLSDRLLDRNKNPAWQGRRTCLLKSFPTNLDQWQEYAEILRADLRAGLGRDRATNFYRRNRRVMNDGAIAAWPARFEPGQISAVQYCMDLWVLNREAFEAEYQNQPLKPIDESATKIITADELLMRMNALERGRIPLQAQHLTAYIDVHKNLLYWMVCWWGPDFTGGIVDFGAWPDQKRNHFSLDDANPTIQIATKRSAVMPAVRVALDTLISTLMTKQWKTDEGTTQLRIDRLGVDANWGQSTNTVFAACRESPHSQHLRPCHGKGLKVTAAPMATWKTAEGQVNGGNWFRAVKRGIRYLTIDTNHWKTFVHNGLNLFPQESHSISLFKAEPHELRMLVEHLTAEISKQPKNPDGRTVEVWEKMPGRENHLFDGLVGNAVMASELGISLEAKPKPKRVPRKGPIEPTYL